VGSGPAQFSARNSCATSRATSPLQAADDPKRVAINSKSIVEIASSSGFECFGNFQNNAMISDKGPLGARGIAGGYFFFSSGITRLAIRSMPAASSSIQGTS